MTTEYQRIKQELISNPTIVNYSEFIHYVRFSHYQKATKEQLIKHVLGQVGKTLLGKEVTFTKDTRENFNKLVEYAGSKSLDTIEETYKQANQMLIDDLNRIRSTPSEILRFYTIEYAIEQLRLIYMEITDSPAPAPRIKLAEPRHISFETIRSSNKHVLMKSISLPTSRKMQSSSKDDVALELYSKFYPYTQPTFPEMVNVTHKKKHGAGAVTLTASNMHAHLQNVLQLFPLHVGGNSLVKKIHLKCHEYIIKQYKDYARAHNVSVTTKRRSIKTIIIQGKECSFQKAKEKQKELRTLVKSEHIDVYCNPMHQKTISNILNQKLIDLKLKIDPYEQMLFDKITSKQEKESSFIVVGFDQMVCNLASRIPSDQKQNVLFCTFGLKRPPSKHIDARIHHFILEEDVKAWPVERLQEKNQLTIIHVHAATKSVKPYIYESYLLSFLKSETSFQEIYDEMFNYTFLPSWWGNVVPP